MTQPIGSGAPTPVQGVTGGPGLPQGTASIDGETGNVVIQPPGNTVQIKKTDSPQSLQVYEYFHTNTDFARIALDAQIGGPFSIDVETEPPSVIRGVEINAGGSLAINTNNVLIQTSVHITSTLIVDTSIQGGSGLFLGGIRIGNSTNTLQSSLYSVVGVPPAALGINGDYAFRADTPATALQRIYVRSAGAWVGIV
jgi:hypothetical protein